MSTRFLSIDLPPQLLLVLHTLEAAGYPAYLVGGSLRDALRGVAPHDFDVTTPATPDTMLKIFAAVGLRTIETGLKHGTITVLIHGEPIECTTYRVESTYSDGRHPDAVQFTDRIADDLCRRDFTVNAMACRIPAAAQKDFCCDAPLTVVVGENAELVDLYGGQEDLAAGVLRCVGEPTKRFEEDALRILRCVRFAVQLGFDVEEETRRALKSCRERLEMVSRERCAAEWIRLLECGMPIQNGLALIREADLWPFVLPEAPAPFDEIAVLRAAALPPEAPLRIASLLRSTYYIYMKKTAQPSSLSELARRSCRALKLSNVLTDLVAMYVGTQVEQPLPSAAADLRRLMARCGEHTPGVLLFWAISQLDETALRKNALPKEYDSALAACREIAARGDCLTVGALALDGRALVALGLRGRQIGAAQAYLLEKVLKTPSLNTPDALRALLQKAAQDGELPD